MDHPVDGDTIEPGITQEMIVEELTEQRARLDELTAPAQRTWRKAGVTIAATTVVGIMTCTGAWVVMEDTASVVAIIAAGVGAISSINSAFMAGNAAEHATRSSR